MPNNADVFAWKALITRRLGRWEEAVRDGEKALALDPRDPARAPDLVETYIALRRYADADRVLDNALDSVPPQFSGRLWRLKSLNALSRGDIKAARRALEAAPIGEQGTNYDLLHLAMLERNYAEATRLLSTVTQKDYDKWRLLLEGLITRANGETERSKKAFESARDLMRAESSEPPFEVEVLGYSALVDAGLGRKEEALREAQRAVDLCPLSRDATDGAVALELQALVYLWTGQPEAALQEIATLVSIPICPHYSPPARLSVGADYGDLAFNPAWDGLRGDPRFEKLLAQAAAAPLNLK